MQSNSKKKEEKEYMHGVGCDGRLGEILWLWFKVVLAVSAANKQQ